MNGKNYGPKQEQIEKNHGDEMKAIIMRSYNAGTPGCGEEILKFHEKINMKDAYPVWKRLEKFLFEQGKIPHIETPVTA